MLSISKISQNTTESDAWPNTDSDMVQMHLFAREAWNERYGRYIAEKNTWRQVAMISLLIALASLTGMVIMMSQHKVVPYIVAVDKLGNAMPAQKADEANRPSTLAIKAHLGRWITSARSVYFDAAAQYRLIQEAYASVNRLSPARNLLDEFYKQNTPSKIAQDQQITAQVQSVLPLSEKTYRIEWKEERRGRDGRLIQSSEQQAVVTIAISPPSDEATILANPLGIYITSFSWGERL